MKNLAIILSAAAMAGLCACTEKAATEEVPSETPQALFKVFSKAALDTDNSLTRLYVAERLSEHDNDEALHCCLAADLAASDDGSGMVYSLSGMTAQWYKFAFVSVPDGISYQPGDTGADGMIDGERMLSAEDGCDFNSITIDYSRVLEAQQADVTLPLSETSDLHIYRKIIGRWLLPDATLTEDVVMSRITGRLVVDMGIPEDQFPQEVEYISITMRTPTVMYLHDEDDGSVLTKDNSEEYYVFRYTSIPWNQRKHFTMTLDLIPSEVVAEITVSYKGSAAAEVYSLAGNEGSVVVKPSTMTTVLFNGIRDGFREVRYAGFPEDAVVDVAPDEWDE